MDLITLFRIVFRQWTVLLPTLALTVVTAALLSRIDSATYYASGSVLIEASGGGAESTGIADAELQPTADRLADELEDVADQLIDGPTSVAVTSDPGLPLIEVTTEGPNGESVLAALSEIVAGAGDVLFDLQAMDEDIVAGASVDAFATQAQPTPRDGGGFTASAVLRVQIAQDAAADEDVMFTSTLLRERFRDDAAQAQLTDAGATAEIEVYPAEDGRPILRVDATGDDAETVVLSSQLAVEKLEELLEMDQTTRGVPAPQRATLSVIAFPQEAVVLETNTMRIVLAVLALGTLASVGAALMFDAAITSRRQTGDHVEADEALDPEAPVVGADDPAGPAEEAAGPRSEAAVPEATETPARTPSSTDAMTSGRRPHAEQPESDTGDATHRHASVSIAGREGPADR